MHNLNLHYNNNNHHHYNHKGKFCKDLMNIHSTLHRTEVGAVIGNFKTPNIQTP